MKRRKPEAEGVTQMVLDSESETGAGVEGGAPALLRFLLELTAVSLRLLFPSPPFPRVLSVK